MTVLEVMSELFVEYLFLKDFPADTEILPVHDCRTDNVEQFPETCKTQIFREFFYAVLFSCILSIFMEGALRAPLP